MPSEATPLLPSDRPKQNHLDATLPAPSTLPTSSNPSSSSSSTQSRLRRTFHTARTETHRFLVSKTGHYAVLLLVSLDVGCIFADFLISLYRCEHYCGGRSDGKEESLVTAQEVLGSVSVAFSCLFTAELCASVWAFGPRDFFTSRFHVFDALVIIAGFVLDVCLKGVIEEVGSLVVVLRLWRVFKIIEEFSAGAEEQMEKVQERVEALERENEGLRRRVGVGLGRAGEEGGYE